MNIDRLRAALIKAHSREAALFARECDAEDAEATARANTVAARVTRRHENKRIDRLTGLYNTETELEKIT